MVQLLEVIETTLKALFVYFNSTMVQLLVKIQLGIDTISALFQFHYGSIISQLHVIVGFYVSGFQFHYGSIIRFESKGYGNEIPYFNSTMVQLLVVLLF